MIDFTECQIDTTANYGGSEQKRGILLNKKRYMLKLSERIPDIRRNSLNSSYSNSAYSEYICCHILKAFGFSVQNVLLGTITQQSSRTGETKVSPVAACENFIDDNHEFVDFKAIEGSLLLKRPPKIPLLDDIYEIFSYNNVYFPSKEKRMEALNRYWDTFIMDALFGNFDRHANNWGYLVNKKTNTLSPAPIFDCGSCLYPQLSDDAIMYILSNPSEIDKRIKQFPMACLMNNQKKVNYMDYIYSLENPDCTNALLRVFPIINMEIVHHIIDMTEGISDNRKFFYKTMLQERYDRILVPAYEKARSQKKLFTFDEITDFTQSEFEKE